MIFLSAQPLDKYFVWQIEVQINNFRKFNLSDKMHVTVWYPKVREGELTVWYELSAKYPEVKFFYYEDEGVNLKLYIPQLRPHILKKHFKEFPELTQEVIFYHDSDIIFNFLPDFDKLSQGPVCWESNTSSYLDYDYIVRKEIQGAIPDHKALRKFAKIGKISTEVIKSYNGKTGGAQYILKGIDSDFWKDVEKMCIEIREAFAFTQRGSINNKYFKSENEGFQSWCADMWAVNFSLWKRGIPSDVTDELDFSWATDSIERYRQKPIYHNAGSTGQPGIFHKAKWMNESPIGKNLSVDPKSASSAYVAAINAVK